MKVKLTKVLVRNTNKAGQQYMDKNTKPYNVVSIQTEQHKAQYLSGLAYSDSPALKWKAGEEVDIEVETRGQYLNFRLPKQNPFEGLNNKIKELEARVSALEAKELPIVDLEEEPEIDPNQVPF